MLRAVGVSYVILVLSVSTATAQQQPAASGGDQSGRAPTQQDVLAVVENLVEQARALREVGKVTESGQVLVQADEALRNLLASDPRNLEAKVLRGELLMDTGDTHGARGIFKEVIADDPSNFRANLAIGKIYVFSRYWRQATQYLETAAGVAPRDRRAEALRLVAISYQGQGKRSEAVARARQAIASDPNDIDSLRLLVDIYMESEDSERALESAKTLLETARRVREENPADRKALQDLISANQTQIRVLAQYYSSLSRRDARGRPTDQIAAGNETEAVRVLSEIAYRSEETAKLSWELSYHQTLQLLEPVARLQPDAIRERLLRNTRYLTDLAALYEATHQDNHAAEVYQLIAGIAKPSDADLSAAQQNQQAAREWLHRQGLPISTPAVESDQPS